VKVLTISDVEVNLLYSPRILERFTDVDLILSCGDLPYYYLEYMVSMLDVPLIFVHGNHHNQDEEGEHGARQAPWGGFNLHRRVHRAEGLLMAGIEGSLRYNNGPGQYSQSEMWMAAWALIPGLLLNRLRFGRYLDVLISHAPPWGIQDAKDRPHQGAKAFLWLDRVFKPAYHFHGHTHLYRMDAVMDTKFHQTHIVNTYGYRVTELFPGRREVGQTGLVMRGW
jgi:Icc-related predicted phosphoesterase